MMRLPFRRPHDGESSDAYKQARTKAKGAEAKADAEHAELCRMIYEGNAIVDHAYALAFQLLSGTADLEEVRGLLTTADLTDPYASVQSLRMACLAVRLDPYAL
jgi:hypothetical protein